MAPTAGLEVLSDEDPVQTVVYEPETLHLNFLLDRSGSMSGQRIIKAREALIFFLRSMPAGCLFSIVSFGSGFEYYGGKNAVLECNQENVEGAIKFCQTVTANLGGTEILKPMQNIVNERKPNHRTRIFCFTDGCVSNSGQVIELSADKNIIVHSVGIGNGCDRNMLESMAKTGRGSCSLIKDDEGQSVLGGKVIQALLKSLEPALEHCTLKVGHALREMDTIFRG